jgi:hypothetical protein
MAQAFSHQLLAAEAQVQSHVSPCGICFGQSGNGTGAFLCSCSFLLLVSLLQCSILIHWSLTKLYNLNNWHHC